MEEKIVKLLSDTNRKGMDQMVNYLCEGDFFNSPASLRFHNHHEGGLADHSYRVYELLVDFCQGLLLDRAINPGQEPLVINPGCLEIVGLLHDVCKMGAYVMVDGKYKRAKGHPKGHATLSLERIGKYVRLTPLEEMMIRYHMGIYGTHEFQKRKPDKHGLAQTGGEYPLRGDETKSKAERRGKSLANAWYHNPIVKVMYFCDERAALTEMMEL